jgi:hypothetical protein
MDQDPDQDADSDPDADTDPDISSVTFKTPTKKKNFSQFFFLLLFWILWIRIMIRIRNIAYDKLF